MSAKFTNAPDLMPIFLKVLKDNPERFNYLDSKSVFLRRRVAPKPSKWYARISLVSERFVDIFEPAVYVMEVDTLNFDPLDEKQKEAVVYHELCHTFFDDEKEKYKLVDHDIKEFVEVLDLYGSDMPSAPRVIKAVKNNEEKKNRKDKVVG